jgi:uncharacterized membrane-anchored protein YhcB (DUF1043 family)
MEMDVTTAVTIITVASLFIGAFFGTIKMFRAEKKEWQKPLDNIQHELESYRHNSQLRFAEFENKIQLLAIDAEKIQDVKVWVEKVEKTINEETTKLEHKFDELMRIIIDLMGKK